MRTCDFADIKVRMRRAWDSGMTVSLWGQCVYQERPSRPAQGPRPVIPVAGEAEAGEL